MTSYGYARVSTDGQTLDAQIAALAGFVKVNDTPAAEEIV